MVKSLVSKLSSASTSLTIAATSFGGNHAKAQPSSGTAVAGGSSAAFISGDNYMKYRNDPGRFFGDGVQFKAKLIGILEVGEARGDRMCQEALQDLKMAIRAAGEHKQRITIHVTIDGLRLRDEKTGDSLYHHPVHKISFIAQDMSDSRAFGYIFGSPDSGHRFFGIKTDKAASQVVLAMRDLFQVVFELKKKEIELARQQIQSKSMMHHQHDQHQLSSLASLKSAAATSSGQNDLSGMSSSAAGALSMLNSMVSSSNNTPSSNRLGVNLDSKGASKEISPESVADLVDLEQELSSLQRGISQMERITPNEPQSSTAKSLTSLQGHDPFGDSFTNFPTYGLLPPPEPGRSRSKSAAAKTNDISSASSAPHSTLLSPNGAQNRSSPAVASAPLDDEDDNWLRELDAHNDVFDTSKTIVPGLMGSIPSTVSLPSRAPLAPRESTDTPPNHIYETVSCSAPPAATSVLSDLPELSQITGSAAAANVSSSSDVNSLANSSSLNDIFQPSNDPIDNTKLDAISDAFTDLDPLGTGRIRPYIDKKYFFHELKNPPKKVLKDLTASNSTANILEANQHHQLSNNKFSDDILNLSDFELQHKTSSSQQLQHYYQQQLLSATTTTTAIATSNFNSLLTNTTGTTNNNAINSSSSSSCSTSLLTSTIATKNISSYNTNNNNNNSSFNNNNNTTNALLCTCPSSTTILSTFTTSNVTATGFTSNNSINSTSGNQLLTQSTNMTSGGGGGAGLLSKASPQSLMSTNPLRFPPRYTLEPVEVASDPVLLSRDTDPFSPTRKKSDPFEEGGDLFSKLDPFEFEFNSPAVAAAATAVAPATEDRQQKPNISPPSSAEILSGGGGGQLQVNLPPENDQPPTTSTIRLRPAPSSSMTAMGQQVVVGPTSSMLLKQQTADVISSISNKKMPHLFGQSSRFSKRTDSNNINMRRLQESDSLSENETAPEPPPRPDSATYIEPPPLPPKKQFSDIIRPRTGSMLSSSSSSYQTNRYEIVNSSASAISNSKLTSRSTPPTVDVPPIPLPSRKIGRSDGSYPGPGRPRKTGYTEDDYLSPLGIITNTPLPTTAISCSSSSSIAAANPDVPPPLLPPPIHTSNRNRNLRQHSLQETRQMTNDIYENKQEILQQLQQQKRHLQQQQSTGSEPAYPPPAPPPPHPAPAAIVPDITLSQLLTLGIDELAAKLNVPTVKLSTMTLVELTSYLSEFLEESKPQKSIVNRKSPATQKLDDNNISRLPTTEKSTPIFKVNFDQESTFVAKFDDTFGEDFQAGSFETNFAQFDKVQVEPPVQPIGGASTIPSADRYAVFREIIDQELQQQQEDMDLIGDEMEFNDSQTNTSNSQLRNETAEFHVDFPSSAVQFETTNRQQDLLSSIDPLEEQDDDATQQPPTIDTKISEVLAQAKDRYAALRDLILVENLFDKPKPVQASANTVCNDDFQLQNNLETAFADSKTSFQGFSSGFDDDDDQDLKQLMDQNSALEQSSCLQQQRLGLVDSRGYLMEASSSALTVEDDDDDDDDDDEDDERRKQRLNAGAALQKDDAGALSSGDSNEKECNKNNLNTAKYEQLANSNQQLEQIESAGIKLDGKLEDDITPKISITQSNAEDNYLCVASAASSAISGSKDDLEIDALMQRAISQLSLDSRERTSPAASSNQNVSATIATNITPQHFNDVSTSPIPQHRTSVVSSQAATSPSNKSPQPQQQISPLSSQLTAVSQLIDTATRQIHDAKSPNESWATFDTPQHVAISGGSPQQPSSDKRARPSAKSVLKSANFLNLPPPPGSTPSCSQNEINLESPCSSDPRDEAWHKRNLGGSSLSLGHPHSTAAGQRRYQHKKEQQRQHTSSSSRDLSWDEDQGGRQPAMEYSQGKRAGSQQQQQQQQQGSMTTDRHGYYRRQAKRMNSCDEDYDFDQEYATSRREQQRKHKQSLSRSRDNFDMDSPGWYPYHHGQYSHHTWSSQDIEQVRGGPVRSFDRSAYERTTYGPPIYDTKRGMGGHSALPPPNSFHDRRSVSSSYDKRGKYYRNSSERAGMYGLDDFDEMLAASGGKLPPPHHVAMYDEMKPGDCCSPALPPPSGHHRQRSREYMYENERRSFDRESLESFEGGGGMPSSVVQQRRRRRSYDSGGMPSDPYGSCDSRDDYYRERGSFMPAAEKTRSLRKSSKSLRVAGDIDYEQDSEKEYHNQRSRVDSRSLQRPSQLTSVNISSSAVGASSVALSSQGRIRKSSGSSPWDGEEVPLPGQKPTTSSSWKRPSSAADSERRAAESRRAAVKGQTPSGSEDDKDRRYRKKRGTPRVKELPGGGRYRDNSTGGAGVVGGRKGNYDYISCQDLDDDAEDYVDEEEEEDQQVADDEDISPADEDKFARLEMRRHEMHNRMMDAHVRRRKEMPSSASMGYRTGGNNSKAVGMKNTTAAAASYGRKALPLEPKYHSHPQDFGYDDDDGEYEETPTPRSLASSALPTATPSAGGSTKFSFDVGFESDFNQSSPPPAPAGTASSCNSTPATNVSAANTPASKSSFRFSNDFSAGLSGGGGERSAVVDRLSQHAGSLQQYELDNRGISPQSLHSNPTSTPKLRFDDNVKVSQFDAAFDDDDFSKATFDAFENEDQWQETSAVIQRPAANTNKQQMRNSKLQQRQQELIKKSESINIFAKKSEDPFEDDDFFNSPPTTVTANDNQSAGSGGGVGAATSGIGDGAGPSNGNMFQQWDDDNNTNFAKFDENM